MRKLIILTTILLTACQTQADAETPDYSAKRGEQVFTKHCATCHGASGEGIEPWYPSLQRLAAMREPNDMIETVITGRFRRGGEVVNYIQQNWGEGAKVSIQDVSATRAQLWELD